jgi:hypothetical protein
LDAAVEGVLPQWGLCRFMPEAKRVRIVGLEEFIKLVNAHRL